MSTMDTFEVEKHQERRKSFIPDTNRGQWGSKTEFILSCLGYAIGIGNVWRFPYLCYRNGGGAFLVPYISMLVVCGIPLFFLEIVIGQFGSTGCIAMFRMCPLLKGAGYAIVVVNLICTIYYAVIISYPVLFFIKSLSAELPWNNCLNEWNTAKCVELEFTQNITSINLSSNVASEMFRSPADEFFHNEILKISDGIDELGGIVWPLFYCLCFSWIVVLVCIIKGVKTIGKVVYFTATFPFIILTILFFRGITLPGAMTGIKFYIYPDWNRLMDLKVWADAAQQIFFSLGPGWGGIINMASYNQFHNQVRWDAIIIPIINSSTSIFAGFVVFSVLGYLSTQTGIPVSKVATSGPGLAFVTYPEAIGLLPLPQLWAALFFMMLFLLGLDSVFVQIEAIISSIIDEFKILRKYKLLVTISSCLIMFFISTLLVTEGGMFILQLLDWYAASISVILICIVECAIVGWTYGIKRFADDIFFMTGRKVDKIFLICWKFITPFILLLLFITAIVFNRRVTFNEKIYPEWAIILGWSTCISSIVFIPFYAFYLIIKSKGTLKQRLKKSIEANDWFPALSLNKQSYEIFLRTKTSNKDLVPLMNKINK